MDRMERERKTISKMISLYCRSQHGSENLCEECRKLEEYAYFRLEKCPFQEKKPACQNCSIHCYKPDMKEQVKAVMKSSGPKMIVHNPYYAIMHIIDTFKKPPEWPGK